MAPFIALVCVLCDFVMKQGLSHVEWLSDTKLATLSKFQGAHSYHIGYPEICQ